MKDVMIDIETLGTRPGSVIISLGAVFFSPTDLGAKFYMVINQISARSVHSLTIDKRTVEWWDRQSPEARQVLDDSQDFAKSKTLGEVLNGFNGFLKDPSVRVWGNGASFDNVLLRCAYEAANIKPLWSFRADMCYRTLKNLFPDVPSPDRLGTHHHALDDAIHQAVHAGVILRKLK